MVQEAQAEVVAIIMQETVQIGVEAVQAVQEVALAAQEVVQTVQEVAQAVEETTATLDHFRQVVVQAAVVCKTAM